MKIAFKLFILVSFLVSGLVPLKVQASPLSFGAKLINTNLSLNWSGYIARAGKFTSVTGSWTVPDVRNNKHYKADAAWVGIGGVTSRDLIQAGTSATTGLGGKVIYQSWYELLPGYSIPLPVIINPGDKVAAAINQISKTQWKIDFINLTSGKKITKNVRYTSKNSSAEWIEEMPSSTAGLLALDNFKAIRFTSASAIVNNKPENLEQLRAQPVSLANQTGKIMASPSDIDQSGSGFSVTRLH